MCQVKGLRRSQSKVFSFKKSERYIDRIASLWHFITKDQPIGADGKLIDGMIFYESILSVFSYIYAEGFVSAFL